MGGCQAGQSLIAESQYPNLPGTGTATCLSGVGEYCCNNLESLQAVCGFEDVCLPLGDNGEPIGACQTGKEKCLHYISMAWLITFVDSTRPRYMTYAGYEIPTSHEILC